MLKFVGNILILVACSGIGFSKSLDMKNHLNELEELQKIFCLLKSELQYTRATFAELFEKISDKIRSPYKEWMRQLCACIKERNNTSFWEMWCTSIDESLKDSRLKEEEIRELKNVGKNLEYVENIDLFIEQMDYRMKQTREEYRTKTKLCQSMGIMGGIFLVVLLF